MRLLSAFLLVFVSAAAGCVSGTPAQGNGAEAGAEGGAELAGDGGGGDPVPTTNAVTVVVGTGFCGGAPGTCNGREATTVDLAKSSIESSACVASGDGGTSDTTTTRPLSTTQAAAIRAALGNLRFVHSKLESLDGRMEYVYITDTSGTTRRYSPEATCGGDYDKIVEGFSELSKAVRGN